MFPRLPFQVISSLPTDVLTLNHLRTPTPAYESITGVPLSPYACRGKRPMSAAEVARIGQWSEASLERALRHLDAEDTLAREILIKLLHYDPRRRCNSLREVLEHPFFSGSSASEDRILKKRESGGNRSVARQAPSSATQQSRHPKNSMRNNLAKNSTRHPKNSMRNNLAKNSTTLALSEGPSDRSEIPDWLKENTCNQKTKDDASVMSYSSKGIVKAFKMKGLKKRITGKRANM